MRWALILLLILPGTLASVVVGQTIANVDEVAVDSALGELEAAGMPVTVVEMSELAARIAPHRAGFWQVRVAAGSGKGPLRTGRLRWKTGRWEVRGRWRQRVGGQRRSVGIVGFESGHWRALAGRLGLSQGFGLLAGRPGRAPSLTVDGGLGVARSAVVPWLGGESSQALTGVAVSCEAGSWVIEGIAGRSGPLDISVSDWRQSMVVAGRIQMSRREWRVSVLSLAVLADLGVSAVGQWHRGAFTASGEAVWLSRGLGTGLTSGVTQIRWRLGHQGLLELLTGWSDKMPQQMLGQRQALFGGWAGRGMAIRGAWKIAPDLKVGLLWHRGRPQDRAPGQHNQRQLIDVQVARDWSSRWRGEMRWRERQKLAWNWSERYPWQPAELHTVTQRRVLKLKIGWTSADRRATLSWYRLDRVTRDIRRGIGSSGTRSLLALAGYRRLVSGWKLRASWALSWGGDEDLVSAIVPLSGYVVPRHWGRHRAERMLGLGWQGGGRELGVAAAWRQARLLGNGDSWSLWAEGMWSW